MEHSTSSGAGHHPRLFDVLILENDRDCREMLAYLLESNFCVVRAAGNLRDAEAALLERTPDVVVSDLRLDGDESGWAFADRMRNDPKTRHIARIAMTGGEPSTNVAGAFDAYLRKPVDTGPMLQLVRQLAAVSRVERRLVRSEAGVAKRATAA